MKNFYKLIQGDCLKVLPTLEDQSIDFILTDPPFNVSLKYNNYEDEKFDENYSDWCKIWLREFHRILKIGHYGIVFSGDKKLYYLAKALNESGLRFHHFLKWHKPHCQRALSGTVLFGRTELAFVFSNLKPNISLINRKIIFQDTIICDNTSPNEEDSVEHNARRPVKLYQQLIEGFTKEGDLVLDCFLGSGTTFLAANNRDCIGIEIDPSYCEIIKKRCFGRQFLDREVSYEFVEWKPTIQKEAEP